MRNFPRAWRSGSYAKSVPKPSHCVTSGSATHPISEIFEAARNANAVILTKDADFVELVYARGPPPQVVWITCGNSTNRHLKGILAATFQNAMRLLERGEAMVEIAG